MFENKHTGWSKSKGTSELQTKEQVQEEVYKQAQLAEEQTNLTKQKSFNETYGGRDGKYGDKRGGRDGKDRRDDGKQVYHAK